jgi:hypothetical protein
VKELAASMVDYVAFESDDEWRLVRRDAVLDALQTLEFGPQLWFVVSEDKALMDLLLAVESNIVPLIEEPSSLEVMLNWFQQTGSLEVLVAQSGASFSLVSRHRLDQFLLKND